jgi:hypothetical protein
MRWSRHTGLPPRVDLDHTPLRWCYEGDVAIALPQLAAGRTQLESDPVLAKCLDRAIALHLAANGQEVLDVRLPVACSGLELLAWSVLQQHGWLSPRAIKSLDAWKRAQLLLKWAGIPTDHIQSVPALAQRKKNLSQAMMQAVELASTSVKRSSIHRTTSGGLSGPPATSSSKRGSSPRGTSN